MKLFQSPLFYAAIINLILFFIAVAKMTKAPDGAAILSLIILGVGILITGVILLVDLGIRALPIRFYFKAAMQFVAIAAIWFFEQSLLLGFLNYKP